VIAAPRPVLDPSAGEYLDVQGVRTFYIKAGTGDPVVLVHGAAPGACSLINWHLNIWALAEAGLTVYAFDQPGFGYSQDPSDDSIEYRVQHARAFVNALGLTRFHLVGNSVGAYIATRLALEDDRLHRLVVTASSVLAPPGPPEAEAQARSHSAELRAFQPSRDSVRALTTQTLYRRELVTPELVEARYAMSVGSRFAAQQRRQGARPARSIQHELPRLRQKTLIVWGAHDRGAAVERALPLLRLIPDAELHIFDHCGHWVQWDQAARFNRLVADFLLS
jgi:pimeloyl-ACP methyl ester carboxylesterase